MDHEVSDDRLSDLPLGIIHEILGLLPIREAIRTSLLSRNWRNTWTTLPSLLFKGTSSETEHLDDEEYDEFLESTKSFINNVLLHHKGPIHRFEISYPTYDLNLENLEEWVLLCLSRNAIRELIVEIDFSETDELKSGIYSCTKLTKLVLWNLKLNPPPSTFEGFLFLTSLEFDGVQISPDEVERLVAYCPLLERLKIKYTRFFIERVYIRAPELIIRSPNLKVLQIAGNYSELCLYAPLLEYLDMDIMMCHRENQSINTFFTQYLSIGIESRYSTLLFHHLKVIHLRVSFVNRKDISVVARLIIGAPNLHKLKIEAFPDQKGVLDFCFREYFGVAPDFALKKLKYVSLDKVCHYPLGMQLVKLLLETSPALEKMELLLMERVDEVSDKVLGFDKASPNARVNIALLESK